MKTAITNRTAGTRRSLVPAALVLLALLVAGPSFAAAAEQSLTRLCQGAPLLPRRGLPHT